MKKISSIALWLSPTLVLVLLVACCISFSSCDDPEVCEHCNEGFSTQKKVKQITHQNVPEGGLIEKFKYFYQDDLIDSIYHVKYTPGPDSVRTKLTVTYPDGVCLPSGYVSKTYRTGLQVKVERAMMTLAGDVITNKHIAFYDDEDYLGVSENADIDYLYNGSGLVTGRNGTDFGIQAMFPSPYGNLSSYTYSGVNISGVSTQLEQAGYTLTVTFDANNNPFSIQGGALYYLFLTSYPDMEHFETLCRDGNNPTQIVYQGTDTSNQHVTITYTFTYTYDSDNYPLTVVIVKSAFEDIGGTTTVTNLGRYNFSYY